MAIPITILLKDQPALVTISPNATLQEAAALMIENDFSQLPIIDGGKPYGRPASFVTATSITLALHSCGTTLKELHVRDAAVPARTVSADEDLFSRMDDLLNAYAMLILNPDGTLSGIVTNYDTTQYFRHRTEDMLLVEDIETTLKDHIRAAYGGDENDPDGPLQTAIRSVHSSDDSIRKECRQAFKKFCHLKKIHVDDVEIFEVVDKPFDKKTRRQGFDDQTLNDYIHLARRAEAWKVLKPHFDVTDKAFMEMLEGVRGVRNKLMHFRPDITLVERKRLRYCADWFKNHPPLTPEADFESTEGKHINDAHSLGAQNTLLEQGFTGMEENASNESDNNLIESEPAGSKYALLANLLLKYPKNRERVEIRFSEIEELIGTGLPPAAREHRSWWANDPTTHVHSGQWLNVNWRVVSINMTEEKVVFARARDRERDYIRFFNAVQLKLRKYLDFPLHPSNPTGANWLTLVNFTEGVRLGLSFALRQQRLRLEVYIDTGDSEENNHIFDTLFSNRELIESGMGQTLEWDRLVNRRAKSIALYTEGTLYDEPEKIDALVDWTVDNALRLHKIVGDDMGMYQKISIKRIKSTSDDHVKSMLELYRELFPEGDGTNYSTDEILSFIDAEFTDRHHVKVENILLVAVLKDEVVGFILCHLYTETRKAIVSYFANNKNVEEARLRGASRLLLQHLKGDLFEGNKCDALFFELQGFDPTVSKKDRNNREGRRRLFKRYAKKFGQRARRFNFQYQCPRVTLAEGTHEYPFSLYCVGIREKISDKVSRKKMLEYLRFIYLDCYGDIYPINDPRFKEHQEYLVKLLEHYESTLPQEVSVE